MHFFLQDETYVLRPFNGVKQSGEHVQGVDVDRSTVEGITNGQLLFDQ